MTSPEASTDAASSSAKNGLPAAERSMAASAPGGSGRPAARRATAASAARSSGPSATSTAAPRSSRLERTQRGRLGERLVAHAGDHEQALAGGAAREVVHQRRRRLVGGVQIVDREHDAALGGGLREQLGDRREDAMAVHGLLRHARRAAHRGQQSREGGLCAVGERARQLRAPRGERVERLHERRVRRAALLLVGGAAQRVKAERLRLGEHSLDEARLADPERARDEQRAAIGGRGTPQRAGRRGELTLTPFDAERGGAGPRGPPGRA